MLPRPGYVTSASDPIHKVPPMRLVGCALRLRCPYCGSPFLFQRWVVMAETCPRCRLKLDREEADYLLGSYVVNFVVAELLIVIGAGVTILLTLPDVRWTGLTRWLFLLATVTPILFYPFAKTIWLAIDLNFRTVTGDDLQAENKRDNTDPHRCKKRG